MNGIIQSKMSYQTKRTRIEASGIAGSAEDGGQPEPGESETDVSSKSGFDSLPDEMLVKVFSYLEHGDKLCSRLVSKRWCDVVTSSPEFKNSVVYLVKPMTNAKDTLSKSNSSWRNVRFQNFSLDLNQLQDFRVLDGMATNVASVEFIECVLYKTAFKPMITMFSNLEALRITTQTFSTYYDRASLEALATHDRSMLEEKWAALMPKLRVLDITAPAAIMLQFSSVQDNLSNLVTLRGTLGNLTNGSRDQIAVMKVLYQIISASEATLTNLSMQILPGESMDRFFTDVILPLSTGNGRRCSNLARIDFTDIVECLDPLELRNLKILKTFVCSKINLLHVTLPKVKDYLLKEQQDLMMSLPKTVRSLNVMDENYLVPDFLKLFPDLRYLESASHIHRYVSSGEEHKNVRELKFNCWIPTNSTLRLVTWFPNVTKLYIEHMGEEGTEDRSDDLALQSIIKNLTMLQSLEIGTCIITDHGVTGIQDEYCQHLFSSRQIYGNSIEVPAKFVTGVPLCSLKRLNKLAIRCPTHISDVGIVFGFGFNQLRFLHLDISNGITNWGLGYLGKLNSNLEDIKVEFSYSSYLSPAGISNIWKQLRRIRDHHKYHSENYRNFRPRVEIEWMNPAGVSSDGHPYKQAFMKMLSFRAIHRGN